MPAASVRRFGVVPLAVFSLLFGALATMSPAIVDAQGPQPRTFLREGAVVDQGRRQGGIALAEVGGRDGLPGHDGFLRAIESARQPDGDPLLAGRPRLRRREERADQRLRRTSTRHPDRLRRPVDQGRRLLGPRPARHDPRPGLPDDSVRLRRSTPTTPRSAARRPSGTTPARRRPDRRPTAA